MTTSRHLLAALLLIAAPSFAQTANAIISGRVVDSKGAPVADATLRFFPFATAIGMLELDTKTAADGSFVLKLQPFGKGAVSAFKITAGFPDAELALYGRRAYPSVAQVDATPGAHIHVDLRFSEPDALIEWTVVSAVTGKPVPHASYRIEWSDNPQIMTSSTIPKDGFFRFVLPRHAVVLRIEAPGFKDWRSTDPGAFGKPLLLKLGITDKRSIMLESK